MNNIANQTNDISFRISQKDIKQNPDMEKFYHSINKYMCKLKKIINGKKIKEKIVTIKYINLTFIRNSCDKHNSILYNNTKILFL